MAGFAGPELPVGLTGLLDLALDLRWTWSHEADSLWRRIDENGWNRTRNPVAVFQSLSKSRLDALAADPAFVEELRRLSQTRASYVERPGWFATAHDPAALAGVAFFSMEFGLSEALPLYAGGLGILAGDFLKTASDLDIPIIGVGLLYQCGYFRQRIDAAGMQQELYPYNDPMSLPVRPVTDDQGGWLSIPLELPGRTLLLRVWQAVVGRTKLYLLDTNDPSNSAVDRGITGKLYDAEPETRLLQEIVLGVGGWRVVQAVAPQVDVCHLNEGHAAFLALERASQFMAKSGLSFPEASVATRAGNIFTTHTPVASGFDRYPLSLVRKYLGCLYDFLARDDAAFETFLGLGRSESDAEPDMLNMAFLALRSSIASFGVSRLHGWVSRGIFQPLFPRWPEAQVPVAHITNGVHIPSWDSEAADAMWTSACGKERWRTLPETLSTDVASISDEALWTARGESRRRLVGQVRVRLKQHLTGRGLQAEIVAHADQVLDPNLLTLGFARRFTGYKRLDLLLRDPDRLARLLTHPTSPIQLVVAGKAHPADEVGKDVIRQWVAMAQHPELRVRLVFLEDYDITLAQELVQGVDVWINTPRRPWEACGTSGMKVLVNGGLNLSELDGWWDEAFTPDVGWAIGQRGAAREDSDQADMQMLYATIEDHIVPEFYDRNHVGVPRRWLARIRQSMAELTPVYSSNRMARDYVEQAYLPAARQLRLRTADQGSAARRMLAWAENLEKHWGNIHVAVPNVVEDDGALSFSAPIYFGDISPGDLRVELYADASENQPAETHALAQNEEIAGSVNGFIYGVAIPATRPPGDYTVLIRPWHSDMTLPTELPLILWQR